MAHATAKGGCARVVEVSYLADGAITKRVGKLPEMSQTPSPTCEVTVRWRGRLLPSNKIFPLTARPPHICALAVLVEH